MIKKLFYSAILLTCIMSSGYGQTTYYLINNAGPISMDNTASWKTNPSGTGTSPVDFTNASDIFDLNGTLSTHINSNLTIAGVFQNSGTSSTIEINGQTLTFTGVVTVTQMQITNLIPNGTVEYFCSDSSDVIPGTYDNISFEGNHTMTVTGDITVNNAFITNTSSGSGQILDMLNHSLIGGPSFTNTAIGTASFSIHTESNVTNPIPSHSWNGNINISFLASSGMQYIPEGSYHSVSGGGTTIVVQAGDTVKVSDNFLNFGGLRILADASGYGQLKATNSVTQFGQVQKQFYLDVSAPRYYHMGVPLNSGNLQDLNDNGTMNFANDSTGSVWAWDASTSEWVVPSTTGNDATQGYAVFAGASSGLNFITTTSKAVDVQATSYHHSDVSTPLDYDDGTSSSATFVDAIIDGWNFIANPFLGNYDFDGHNRNGSSAGSIADYYYVFNGTNYSFYQVSSGVGTGSGTANATQYIAPGQGFWVRASSDWNGSTTFETANIDMSGSASMLQTTLPADILKLNVAEVGGSYSDQVIVRLDQNATDAEDFSLDVPKKSNPGSVPNTYIQLGNGTWALCAANPSRKSFPLHFRDIDHGQQFEYSIWENSLSTYGKVFIEDKKNSSFTEITNANYTFTNDTAYGEDRFVIHFESGIGLPEGMIPGATAYDAFYNNGTIYFTFQEENFSPTSGGLYSLQGKLICSFEINDANTSIAIPNVSTGIYLLALDGDTAGARKLYINK